MDEIWNESESENANEKVRAMAISIAGKKEGEYTDEIEDAVRMKAIAKMKTRRRIP